MNMIADCLCNKRYLEPLQNWTFFKVWDKMSGHEDSGWEKRMEQTCCCDIFLRNPVIWIHARSLFHA